MATTKWFFEPGHTAAEFRARHMMVSYVRGQLKNMHGLLEVDPDKPEKARVEATVDATQVYTGQPQRDAHLRSADFFDVEEHPTWTFVGSRIHQVGATQFEVTGDLTVRGVTRPRNLRRHLLGTVGYPLVGGGAGPRAQATRRLRRHDAYQST